MAKKSRRVRRKKAPPRLSEAQLVRPTKRDATREPVAPASVEAVPAPQPAVLNVKDEYRYVVKDLQRIGILAAVILGGLVALSFVL